MPSGQNEVSTLSKHDVYFYDMPEVLLFDRAYKKIEKFGSDCLSLQDGSTTGNFGSSFNVKFPKSGDFATGVSIEFKTPELVPTGKNPEVAWIAKPGFYFFESIKFELTNQLIEELRPFFMDIYSQLSYVSDKKRLLDEMIGQTMVYTMMSNGRVVVCTDDGPQVFASRKPEYEVLVPIRFWWTEYTEHAFPIIGTVFNEHKIIFSWKDATSCYILRGEDAKLQETPQLKDVKVYLDVIFLNPATRARLLKTEWKTPMRQIQYGTKSIKEAEQSVELDINKPVYEILYAVQEDAATATGVQRFDWYDQYTGNELMKPKPGIKNVIFVADSTPRYEGRGRKFGNRYVPFKHHTGGTDQKTPGTICFAQKPEDWRPTGAYTLTQVPSKSLKVKFENLSSTNTGTFHYASLSYGIFKTHKSYGGSAYIN
jgi:hypothetical protein